MADTDDTPPPLALDQFPPPGWYNAQGQYALPQGSAGQQQATTAEYAPIFAPPPPPPPPPPPVGGQHEQVVQTPTLQQEVALPAPQPQPSGPPPVSNLGESAIPGVLPGSIPSQTVADVANVQMPTERNVAPETQAAAAERVDSAQYKDHYNSLSPDERLAQGVVLTPDQYDTSKQDNAREAQRQRMLNEATAKAAQDDDDRRAEDAAIHQRAQAATAARAAQLDAQIDAAGKQKIDEGTPLGMGIRGMLASVVGGFASQWTGGRNLGLEGFEKAVERHVQVQQQNLANQRQVLGLKNQRLGDQQATDQRDFADANIMRAAAYDSAIRHAQTEAQNYDPQGTAAAQIRGNMQALQQRKQGAMVAYLDDYQKRQIELGKATAEIERNRAQTIEAMAKAGKLAGAGSGGAATPNQIPHPPSDFAAMGLVPPPVPMSHDDYNSWLSMKKAGGEAMGAGETAAKGKVEREAQESATLVRNPVTHEPYADEQGQPVRLPVEQAEKVNTRQAATQNLVDTLSDVRRALNSDPSTFDRRQWADIQARIGQALPVMAAMYNSKFSSREEQALKDITNLDYDSYRKRVTDKGTGMASIDAILQTTKRNADTENGTLIGKAYKTPWLDTSKPADAPDSEDQETIKDIGTVSERMSKVESPDTAERDTAEQHRLMSKLYERALNGTNSERDRAREALQTISEGKTPGSSKELRALAQSMMATVLSASILEKP